MIAELAALALACAPNIHPITLHALISHESRAHQYAIGVNRNGKHLRQQPRTLTEAAEAAQGLIDQGIDFDAGLGQINVRNWAWLNLDTKTVFDRLLPRRCLQSAMPDHCRDTGPHNRPCVPHCLATTPAVSHAASPMVMLARFWQRPTSRCLL